MLFAKFTRPALSALMLIISTAVYAQDPAPPTAAPIAASAAAGINTAAGTETVGNPYGIDALWKGGDFITHSVLVLLLGMSAVTWYLLTVKLIEQRKLIAEAKAANTSFWTSKSTRDGLDTLKSGSPFWYLADRAISASQNHEGTLVEQVDLSSWITMSVSRAADDIQSRLQGGLALLATVGSTAPFVGLLGTVWGIYHALTAIGISGQASIDKVAGPVGEALIMTAIGLMVAIPAVMAYNALVRRNKVAMEAVRAFCSDLHSVLLSGARFGDRKAV